MEEPYRCDLDELDRSECIALLRTMSVGRFAVARKGVGPLVVPVNYTLDGEAIVFRSAVGSKLELLRREPVSFQVDLIDYGTRTGWSVLATGWAHEASSWEAGHVDVDPWVAGQTTHFVRIEPEHITGRRITRTYAPALDARSYL